MVLKDRQMVTSNGQGSRRGNVFTGMGKGVEGEMFLLGWERMHSASKYMVFSTIAMVFSTIAQVFSFYSLFDGLERKIIC